MTLKEMSGQYRASAEVVREQLHRLRQEMKEETDPERRWRIQQRIRELVPILTELNELAELTEHYYDRGYYRGKKYTV